MKAANEVGAFLKAVAISTDGNSVAVGTGLGNGTTTIIDISKKKVIGKPQVEGLNIESIEFSPNGRFLAVGGTLLEAHNGQRGVVVIFEIPSAKERGRIHAHKQNLLSLSFHPSGKTLLTCGSEGQLKTPRFTCNDERVKIWSLSIPGR